jgi:hypothetical protein
MMGTWQHRQNSRDEKKHGTRKLGQDSRERTYGVGKFVDVIRRRQ